MLQGLHVNKGIVRRSNQFYCLPLSGHPKGLSHLYTKACRESEKDLEKNALLGTLVETENARISKLRTWDK